MRNFIFMVAIILVMVGCSNSSEKTIDVYRNDMQQTMEEIDFILAAIRGTEKEVKGNPSIVNDESFVIAVGSLSDQINTTCDYIENYVPEDNQHVQDAHYFLIKAVIEFRYVADNIEGTLTLQNNSSSVSDAIDSALYYIDQARAVLEEHD